MSRSLAAALLAARFSSFASAAVSQQCPTSDSSICYSLNVPDTTASSGTGDIYFQISAPSTYSWVALGQGHSMSGSNIFVIYTSADGKNVTLSPRLGKGNVMPQHDTEAEVTLLEGSGVTNGMMVANVKCSNCDSWTGGTMDFTSTSSVKWIYAAKSGDALDSDDLEESISEHDLNDSFSWDLSTAKGGSDVNPFVSAATSTSSSSSSGSSASASASSGTSSQPTVIVQPSSGGSSGGMSHYDKVVMAHAIMAAVVFAIILPIGGILIRIASFPGLIWLHAGIQILGLLLYTAAFGCGIWMAKTQDMFNNAHPIIGIVLFAILIFQPVLGLMHHSMFKKIAMRGVWSFAHLSVGRIAIILGIINGGLGLKLSADAGTHWIIAYSVVAGVFGVSYIAALVFGETQRARKQQTNVVEERKGSDRENSMESAIPLQER